MSDSGSIKAKRKRAKAPREVRPAQAVDPNQIALAIAHLLPKPAEASEPIAALAHPWLTRKCRGMASGNSLEGRVRKWLLPYLGAHTDQTLKARDVADWISQLTRTHSARGRPLSAQTIRHVWDAGRQIVQEALANDEWRGSNPFANAGAPPTETKEQDTLTAPETAAMLRAVPPLWQPLFATAIYLGPRRGGLRLLRKVDVEKEGWNIWLPTEKTSKRRCVPVPGELQPYLQFALALHPSSEWLFPNPETGGQLSNDVRLCPMLRRALSRLGIRKKLTFHGLRRVSSSLHQEAGCHPWVVSRILGHSQASLIIPENTTSRRYTRFSDEFTRRELNRLTLNPANKE